MQPGKPGGSFRAIGESGTRPLGLVWQAELVLRSGKRSSADENGKTDWWLGDFLKTVELPYRPPRRPTAGK